MPRQHGRTWGPWVIPLLSIHDGYPWLCTEVLNAIIHYKDTIGNSMARVLCSATHPDLSPPPSQPDFLPMQGTVKLISDCNTCILLISTLHLVGNCSNQLCPYWFERGPNWIKLFLFRFYIKET